LFIAALSTPIHKNAILILVNPDEFIPIIALYPGPDNYSKMIPFAENLITLNLPILRNPPIIKKNA
jgi:hypothetical protein